MGILNAAQLWGGDGERTSEYPGGHCNAAVNWDKTLGKG